MRCAVLLVGSAAVLFGAAAGRPVRAGPIQPGDIVTPETVGTAAPKIQELDDAVSSFQNRQYDRALGLLEAARRKHPSLPPVRLMLARLFLASGQVAAGRAALERAAVEGRDYPGVYIAFGNLALAEGRLTDAGLQLEKAAALVHAGRWEEAQRRFFLVRVHAGIAALAEGRGDWAAAREALTRWLEQDPRTARARQRLGRALFHLGKTEEADQELERASRDDPTLDPPAVSMAWLYTGKGNLKKAGEWMDWAVRAAPRDVNVRRHAATWLLQQGKVEEAETHVEAAARLDPSSRAVRHLRGLVARFRKDYAQAEKHFQTLHDEAPADFQAGSQLALVLVEQADEAKRARALQLAEVNARANASSVEALATLGWVYYRRGRLDDAERLLQAAVAGGTTNAETAYYLAHVMADRGRLDTARQLLRAAVDAPGSFPFHKEAREWLDRLAKKPG